jgi:hypothetical protein
MNEADIRLAALALNLAGWIALIFIVRWICA